MGLRKIRHGTVDRRSLSRWASSFVYDTINKMQRVAWVHLRADTCHHFTKYTHCLSAFHILPTILQPLSAFCILHFTFRIPQFHILPITFSKKTWCIWNVVEMSAGAEFIGQKAESESSVTVLSAVNPRLPSPLSPSLFACSWMWFLHTLWPTINQVSSGVTIFYNEIKIQFFFWNWSKIDIMIV